MPSMPPTAVVAEEAIRVASWGPDPADLVRRLLSSGDSDDPCTHSIDNRYYSAEVPVRAYDVSEAGLGDALPLPLRGALVLVLEGVGARSFFESIVEWWGCADGPGGDDSGPSIPLVVSWELESGLEPGLRGEAFDWCVDHGFEIFRRFSRGR
jgi:hypothetical protein